MEQYKVIETKFLPVTNNHGSRIKAFDAYENKPNQITIGYPHELNGVECHHKAARALCDKMGWQGTLIGGWSRKGCAFVLIPSSSKIPRITRENIGTY